ncbi:MAG: NAD(P)H-dependent oxidoreductase [Brachymonas sp.]|nr:NAD(P)H-dependent oxidoreductase [Brachymonas sp.]
MKCLVVIAHPVDSSLCHALSRTAIEALENAGHEVTVEDLYRNEFRPALNASERQSYYSPKFDAHAIEQQVKRLLAAQAIVLVFPTWWFGFPAVLKGWFDRVWAPGIAYDHADNLGAIQPRLHQLQRALAITTLGSPGWVDRWMMWQPIKRILKTALLGTCAPQCRFEMLSLYKAERLTPAQVEAFQKRIQKSLTKKR